MRRGKKDIKFCIRYTKPRTYVQMVLPSGPNTFVTYSVVIDNLKIARKLAGTMELQISGLFGKIWKSVKKIAKKTGISKIVNLARKALPIAAKFMPPPFSTAARGASLALETAADLTRARKARKRGGKRGRRRSNRFLVRAMKRGNAYQKIAGKRKRRKAMKQGARIYKIMVTPT